MPALAVLFDVGGPLDTEITRERIIDAHLRATLVSHGVAVDDASYAAAVAWAVDTFAPNTYQAIVWYLTRHDMHLAESVYRAFLALEADRRVFELRMGMVELLEALHRRGVRLGLAANQPRRIIEQLDAIGIGLYFHHREVSGTHGRYKPDTRLFLRACADLEVLPGQCIMVGDRIDNDIVPAKRLGMPTILFRTGRHCAQQPRSWEERPDIEVTDVPSLDRALTQLLECDSSMP